MFINFTKFSKELSRKGSSINILKGRTTYLTTRPKK